MSESEQLVNTKQILLYWFRDAGQTEMFAFWFDTTPDEYITKTYKELVDTITIDNYKQYCKTVQDKIALLLIGDQFTRNIYRHTEEKTKNDVWALELAMDMIRENIDLTIPLHYRYFVLLPLRHNKNSSLLDLVCSRIALYVKEFPEKPTSLIKFYTYTIQNYTTMTDEIMYSDPSIKHEWKEEFTTVLEKTYPDVEKDHTILTDTIRRYPYERVASSFSGGVDSTALLHALQQTGKYVVAIHVEYVNRNEARLEREFLQYYCALHDIPLYYRTIHYMKRHDNLIDRNIFEEETKKARFHLYKYVLEREHLQVVCMGHHMGDIVENIFTNMFKGRDTTDIKGMNSEQYMFGVTISRPLLSLTKDIIYAYARQYFLPRFNNSTPKWSCRGVMRDNLIPAIKNQFGDVEGNIISFAEQYSFLMNFYTEEITKRLEEKQTEYYTRVKEIPELKDTIQRILLQFMHCNGYAMVSKKTLETFQSWYKGKKENQLQLSKDVFCYYRKNYLYLVNDTKIKKDKPSIETILEQFDQYIPKKIKEYYK
jgi:tRNA(Ile)-lysidine synthetase-like protein